MTEATNGAGPGHNSKARKRLIVNTMKRLEALEIERKAIGDQIAEIKNKEIKGELGMKITDFNIARRVYLLEGEDRRELFATMRETFDALGVGETLNFVTALEKDGDGAAT